MNLMKLDIKKIIFIELGTLLFALAVGLFLLPGNILTGGVAGVVALLDPFIDIDSDILVIIISTTLFIIGAIFLGREFTLNTIVHSLSYPFLLLLVTRYLPDYEIDPLLAAIYGGAIGGIGLGIIFRQGGSSGGMDVISLMLEKYLHANLTKCIMTIDMITVIAGLLLYGVNSVLIGLISVFFTSFALDRTIKAYGGVEAKKLDVISDKYEEISRKVLREMERGTTLIEAEGGYSNTKKKVLMIVVSNNELEEVKTIINKIDPNAFFIISDIKDANGEGFTFEPRI